MMLKRKISKQIEWYLQSHSNKMLIVDGARQIGKSFIIRQVGQRLFPNYIEINMEEDKQGSRLFANARTVEDFTMSLSVLAGERMGNKVDTLVFIDEIQAYDHLLTLVKFLIQDNRFTYIASGSQLGLALKTTQSLPIGSLQLLHMYPLDFEEFLWANGVGESAIDQMRQSYWNEHALSDDIHRKIMDLFKKYMLVGGLPDAVNTFITEHNMVRVRAVHSDIITLYRQDAAKYEKEFGRKLKIQRIYDMIPSNLENKKKRVVAKDIEGKNGKRMANYQDEFDYLLASGVALGVQAISQPTYPLVENVGKNLLKLYLNDIGLFTGILFRNNIQPIMDEECSINLGSVYEAVVAQELRAHGFNLYYYDNKKNGEVDYLVDDADHFTIMPIEVKSGKDYKIHSALDHFLECKDNPVQNALVISNEARVCRENRICYIPIYYSMFLLPSAIDRADRVEI